MKKLLIAAMVFALTSTPFISSSAEANENEIYSAAVGVEVIARTVVEKKLVDLEAREEISAALEAGNVEFSKMECVAEGSDHCTFGVKILDDENDATLFRLNVRVYKGMVVSAVWELIAG